MIWYADEKLSDLKGEHALRVECPLASYEARGNRLVTLFRGLSAAFWEEGRFLYARPAAAAQPMPLELAAALVRKAHAKGRACAHYEGGSFTRGEPPRAGRDAW